MGYLTTFTIYNDGAHLIEENTKQLADAIYTATHSHKSADHSIGHFANMIHSQATRHADDHTVYVHMGNCVTELNAYSKETKALFERNPEFADKLLKFLKEEVKLLIKLRNDKK